MRLVGKIESGEFARKFSHFLKKEKIEATIDQEKDERGQAIYLVWIHDEDKIFEAKKLFQTFMENPQDSKYDIWVQPVQEIVQEAPPPLQKKDSHILTSVLIAICAFIYLLNLMQEISISKDSKEQMVAVITPIQLALFYDAPSFVIQMSKILKEYPLKAFKESSPELEQKIAKIERLPQWRGGYTWLLNTVTKKPQPIGPMFVKIRQKEIWRLFSPCILHTSILHLAFNMLWLWVLGRQIEGKVKKWKMLFMILIAGIITNTCQYLMSGPLFLGFSGVVVTMAGFIWARQKQAPWEGYILNRSTFLFLAIFVFGMLGLQIALFIFQSLGYQFDLNIANTAHIVGGITGYLMGRGSLFAMEVK